MTGFARADGQNEAYNWTVEVKSVNGRNLDIRCRLPQGFDALEAQARAEIAKKLKRGSLNVMLQVNRTLSTAAPKLNRALLDQLVALAQEMECVPGIASPRLDGLLALRGVLESTEEENPDARAGLEQAVARSLAKAIDDLAAMRLSEGTRLVEILDGHLGEIERLIGDAGRCASAQPAALKEKLRTQVQALLDAVPALPEDRLAQEAALLIAKADVREELDRLKAHVTAARDMLAEGGAIGRRFDFLCQEFNREANTLCSKSADVELTRVGLRLKAAIEQLREQVQNIE
ncbi:MAG TPA: YicC/YloC family endoribonuclease [Azospirillaceae bacterium]|nr:YicC/YloC family endoribonuclease [Azospirillaceae bacterium]